jgi:hypothetical protein
MLPAITSDCPIAAVLILITSLWVVLSHACILWESRSKYEDASVINWFMIRENLSIMTGTDSLNLTACEIKSEPNAKMIRNVRSNAIVIATTLLILSRSKKPTTGLRTIAMIVAKTIGIKMLFAI